MRRFLILASMLAALFPCLSGELAAQTEGTVNLTVTTAPTGQDYDPRHVLAVWVTDAKNTFIQSLLVLAERRIEYLYTWQRVSGGDETDAVTGATVSTHQTHKVTWDCRDLAGNLVPDGDYRLRVEFTTRHAQGPLTPETYLQFTKGPSEFTLNPPDLQYFKNMSLTYRPDTETHTFVAAKSVWKYNDKGIDLHASDWKLASYDDASWSQGPGELGYGDLPATTLGFGPDSSNKYRCYYFRHVFNSPFVPLSLKLNVQRDDGVVVYINGKEAARDNMASGPTTYTQLASATVDGSAESTYFTFYVDPTLVQKGDNVIAAEVHQVTAGSSDVSFDLELKAAPPASDPTSFRRGDADGNGSAEVTDAVGALNFLFLGGATPECFSAVDSNDDGEIDIADPVALLIHLFAGGPPLAAPGPDCGPDPTPDELPCESYAACP